VERVGAVAVFVQFVHADVGLALVAARASGATKKHWNWRLCAAAGWTR